MATSGSEGTTSLLCELCNNNPTAKYCRTCAGGLCQICAANHNTSKLFKDHIIEDYNVSDYSAGKSISGLAKCIQHIDKSLEYYCTTCKRYLCEGCKSDHKNHKVKSAKGDITVHKEAYTKYMKDLLDEVHRLEKHKLQIQDLIKSYDDALNVIDRWELQLLDHIKARANALRKELKLARKNYESLFAIHKDKIDNTLDDADAKLSTLSGLRRESNTEILSMELTNTQVLLDKLINITNEIAIIPKVKIVEMLHKSEEVKIAKYAVDDVFNTGGSFSYDVNPDSLKMAQNIEIPNPSSDDGYKISKSNNHFKIIMHGRDTSDIRVFDTTTNTLISQHTAGTNIWSMATTAPDEHVAIDSNLNALHLLDGVFKTVFTIKSKNTIWGVDYLSRNRFVKYELSDTKPYKAYISVMRVDDDKLITEREVTIKLEYEPKLMYVHPDQLHVSLCCFYEQFIYKVNMKDASSSKLALAHKNSSLCIYIDGLGSTWLGDVNGSIHLYDDKFKYRKAMRVRDDFMVRDLVIRQGRLYVTSLNKDKLLMYSSDTE